MQFDTLFERSDSGVTEIYSKSNQLTQTERLVLIMVDGQADVATLIEKLPSLSMPRVFAAINKLVEIGLISQRLMASGTNQPGQMIAQEVIERYLQQSDLDPETIIRVDTDGMGPTTIPPPPVPPPVEPEPEPVAQEVFAARAPSEPTPVTGSVIKPLHSTQPIAPVTANVQRSATAKSGRTIPDVKLVQKRRKPTTPWGLYGIMMLGVILIGLAVIRALR
jgi:hypothetical protein